MKRPVTIAITAVLAILILFACSSTIRTINSSFVTVTIGGVSGTALLKAEAATPWTKFKYYLADAKWIPEAYAYIPSVVDTIIVTVTATDIPTPIVGVKSINATDTSTFVRIEVPNGAARNFLVEGYRLLVDGQIYFTGTAGPVDLNGVDVNLPVSMTTSGQGIYVDIVNGNDNTGDGSQQNPYATISKALTATTGTDVIFVAPGTYPPGGASLGESYPLQLKPGTALVCKGTGTDTILDLQTSATATTAIYGNDKASIDNCLIRVNAPAGGKIAINDAIGGQASQQSRLRVNGANIELSGFPTGLPNIGVLFNDDSLLLESTVTISTGGGFLIGVQVNSGKPSIIGSTISNLPTGIELRATAGDVSISDSFLINNTTVGLETLSTGKPSISNTVFDGNPIGLILGGGNPRVTGSTFINSNNYGVQIISANPEISTSVITKNSIGILDSRTTYTSGFVNDNSIYCNSSFNLSTSITTTPNYQKNAWERSTPQVNGLAVGTNCARGDDICADGPAVPDFSGFKPAVPGVCNRGPLPVKPHI